MHPLLENQPNKQVLMLGNEAIARGALEAGVAFAAAYPGTPSSEIALQFFQISKTTDLYFEYSANEKVALEVAAGAAMCGLRTMASMKHVGLNVASDALMTLAYTGVAGALVLVVADDPLHVFQPERAGLALLRQAFRPAHPRTLHRGRGQGNDRIRL